MSIDFNDFLDEYSSFHPNCTQDYSLLHGSRFYQYMQDDTPPYPTPVTRQKLEPRTVVA